MELFFLKLGYRKGVEIKMVSLDSSRRASKRKWYYENKGLVLGQQLLYREKNRKKILLKKRKQYLRKRTSNVPVKAYKPRRKKVVRLTAKQKAIEENILETFNAAFDEAEILPESRKVKLMDEIRDLIKDWYNRQY